MAVSSATAPNETLSAFLHNFPTPLHYIPPPDYYSSRPWVFWSKDEEEEEGSQITNNSSSSSSADLRPPRVPYHNNIISTFSKLDCFFHWNYILQLWAPVTINGINLLSTSRQPFALRRLGNDDLKKYRLRSMKYHFNIDDDVNNQLQLHIQEDKDEDEGYPIILNGGPAAAFLNCMPDLVQLKDHKQGSPFARYALEVGLEISVMLPICYPSQTSSCIGVVEITSYAYNSLMDLEGMKRALKKVGLGICHPPERIHTIHALKHARDEIEAALKILCKSHKLSLAQVWIPYANVPFSSSLEDTQIKCMRALKLFGHVNEDHKKNIGYIKKYSRTCDVGCLFEGNKHVEMTLQDYKPRLCQNMKDWIDKMLGLYTACEFNISGVAICLKSIDTGDLDYAFEFIWYNTKNNVIFFEALLLRLKKCLPSFKFSSGTELGDELDFHVINDPLDNNDEVSDELESKGDAKNTTVKEIGSLKGFQRKKSSPLAMALKAGKKPTVMDSSSAKWKTAPKQLPQELIEGQFGNTMKEAAENLNVSLSTLKRKCKEYHIYEWQGPNVVKKKKVNASSNNQSNRNEEDNGAIQEPSIANRNENTLTIKAEYADDMIKFDLRTSQASLVNIEKEIGKKLNLTPGTYKLKYLDKDEDLILLTSDEDMSDCIKCFRNLGLHVVRLRVSSFPQKLSS